VIKWVSELIMRRIGGLILMNVISA